MPSSDVHCRWGIVGCGSVAASFVAELQSRATPVASVSTVQHSIACVSSSSQTTSRAFVDAHIHPSAGKDVETFGTLMELLALPTIDAVFVASPHAARFHHASSALRAERAVLVPRPLAMSAGEARELCELAGRSKGNWLGIVARTPSDQHSIEGHLLWAADECARGRATGSVESPLVPWSENIAVLAALDEVRRTGALVLPSEEEEEEEEEAASSTPSHRFSSTAVKPASRSRRSSSSSSNNVTADGQPRASSRASFSSATSGGAWADAATSNNNNNNKTSLRSQVQELQHVLRHKNALIQSLEQKAGITSAGSTASPRTRGRLSLDSKAAIPSTTVTLASSSSSGRRKRTTSTSSLAADVQEEPRSPSPGPSATGPVPRKGAADRSWIRSSTPTGSNGRSTTPDNALRSPISSVNQLGLATVKEGNQSSLALGGGFSAPTIASEGRRVSGSGAAAVPNGLVTGVASNTTAAGSGGGGGTGAGTGTGTGNGAAVASPTTSSAAAGGTSKVLNQLTAELAEVKATLEVTKAGLRTAQRNNTTLQRTLDETKDALGRSRAENEASGQMVARKERQVQEALGRARKAETEAKDLGKASREWGTRVRQVEAELGEERVRKQKAEAQYEAISNSWKTTRELWEREMVELRSANGSKVKENAADAKKMADTMKEALERMRQRQEESGGLEAVLLRLERERERAIKQVEGPVAELVKLLEQNEAVVKRQDGAVEEVQQELKRIIRLMRSPVT